MLKQILQGKHMKCVVEVNISMHLALALICFKEWLTSNGKYKDVINEVTSTTKATYLQSISRLGNSPRRDCGYNDRWATSSTGTREVECVRFYNLVQQQSLQML